MSRVMITIPDEFLIEIDRAAEAEHRNRSELFREAMRQYLGRNKSELEPAVQEAVAVIERLRTEAIKRAGAAQDSTEIIRAFRDNTDSELISDGNASPR